jgi:aspartyl-tRNA(Asn)/glutamyl-tRNA(Gln) amidotransferase subunit B
MEVVSAPDLRSPEQARTYLTTLHSILKYLGVSTGNMQDGSFRCDANISIRPVGNPNHGTRAEIKNMNSFRSVYLALNFEEERQRRTVESGGRIVQETRGWVEERDVTVPQRSKEHAHDYRYFPEPDLPPLAIDAAWVEAIRSRLPELAPQRRLRLARQYGIPDYDAKLITSSKAMADYFEEAVAHQRDSGPALEKFAKGVSNWMLGDLSRLLNLENGDITETKVTPAHLAELIDLIDGGAVSVTMAKTVLEESFATGLRPGQIVGDQGYAQINDVSALSAAVADAIQANPKAVADYLGGKDTATRFLVGQVMKIARGQANPELVNRLVREGLEALKGAASR